MPRTPLSRASPNTLLPFATGVRDADVALATRLDRAAVERIVAAVPEAWLAGEAFFDDIAAHRRAYADHVCARLARRAIFVEEAIRAQSIHL